MNRFSPTTRRAGPPGFTMIELIIVMTIMSMLGLIAALAIPHIQDMAKRRETEATMVLIGRALEEYRKDIGSYPNAGSDSLVLMLTDPNYGWKRASLKTWFDGRKEVVDAWGMKFQYCGPADYPTRGVERTLNRHDYYNYKTYQLYSYGPNMRTFPGEGLETKVARWHLCGTEEDDIRNWTQERFYQPADYAP